MSQEAKIWKALLDWTVLIALITLFVYLGFWTVQYVRINNLSTEISAKQTALKEHNINTNLVTTVQPKLFIISMEKDISIMSSILAGLNETISQEVTEMQNECTLHNNGTEELRRTAQILGLSSETTSTTCQSDTPLDLAQTNEQRMQALAGLNTLSNTLAAHFETEKKAGRFANPLWRMTDSDLTLHIASMSSSEKAGQLLIWGVSGTSLATYEQNDLAKYPVSGIILMGYNISDPGQTTRLTAKLQATNSTIPLIIATDQEGGVVKRVKWDTTAGPKDWAGRTDTEICTLSQTRARTLKSIGINTNLAPVVDLTYPGSGFINNRTISDNPAIVSAKAGSFVKCAQQEGIINTIKHFPGHGATAADSHISLPIITKSKEEWLKEDALPFINNTETKMIMTGQLVMQSIDPNNSATTSRELIDTVLRKELGYKGLIITDDMYQLYTSTKEAWDSSLERAVLAGNDIILYVGLPTGKDKIFNKVVNMVESGTLTEAELDSRLLRILQTKRELR